MIQIGAVEVMAADEQQSALRRRQTCRIFDLLYRANAGDFTADSGRWRW